MKTILDKTDDYINNRVTITKEMFDRADKKSKEIGCMNSKSFEHGAGNIVGFLGEEIVFAAMSSKFDIKKDDKYTHDFSCEINGKIVTFDVKSKKTKEPYVKTFFYASATSYQIFKKIQPVDYYIFARVYFPKDGSNPPFGWICGKIKKEEFLKKATLMKVGDYDDSNGFTVKEECFSLPYSEL